MITPNTLFFGGLATAVVSVYVAQIAYRFRNDSLEGLANVLTLTGFAGMVIGGFKLW